MIAELFNQISKKYDAINTIMSCGLDKRWRSRLLADIDHTRSLSILDIATGTGEIPISLAQMGQHKVVGIDIASKMIDQGVIKIKERGLDDRITLSVGDVHDINFSDNSFDVVTISFGIRNFEKLDVAIKEIHRVLKPQGKFYILELTPPNNFIMKLLYNLYIHLFLIPITVFISRNKTAYLHLKDSIVTFPNREDLIKHFQSNDFKQLDFYSDIFGVVTYYYGEKE